MSASPNATDSDAEVKEQVGQAWSLAYHGKGENAVRSFEGILARWPNHVDANFGMAFALKVQGQREKAAEGFRKTRQLVDQELTKVQGDEQVRYQMIGRIVDQHLATLK